MHLCSQHIANLPLPKHSTPLVALEATVLTSVPAAEYITRVVRTHRILFNFGWNPRGRLDITVIANCELRIYFLR